ncbi:perilipin-3-like isoform X2 [Pantherophis guttatus]|uniref:Perilipin-3-like isoform X2 n=1 Tax=Pantherophis guttatus TaxID=94885 RepID=A0A6P9CHH0_PANGU|nr:perilipin-3-like isoform X2 [Pantherophis guttatus]
MARFWSSEEYKMIAGSSDPMSQTLYLREEKTVLSLCFLWIELERLAINRVTSQCESLDADFDGVLDDRKYDVDLMMETISMFSDPQSRSKSPTRKPKDLCRDNHLNFRALDEQKELVEEDSSPAPQPVVEEIIVPRKEEKEVQIKNQAVQREEKASEMSSRRTLDTLVTPTGPIIILLESGSTEQLKEERKALEEPKVVERELSPPRTPPKCEALAVLPPPSEAPRSVPLPDKIPPAFPPPSPQEPKTLQSKCFEEGSVLRILFERTKPVFDMVPKGLHTIIQEIASMHHPQTAVPTETKDEVDSILVTHKGRLLSQRGKEKATSEETSLLLPAEKENSSAMATSLSSFVVSPVGQVFADTIERALSKSEEWLNYYLPAPESNKAIPGGADTSMQDLCKEGCFMRINSLSTQLRNRAFKIVLHQIKAARQNTHENLSLLDQILEMVEFAQTTGSTTLSNVPQKLANLWTQWNTSQGLPNTQPTSATVKESLSLMPEQLEMKAFLLTRDLARELYHTYHNLLPHISELPAHLQEKVTQIHENLEEMQGYLSSSTNLRDLPNSIVLQSRQKIATARENLDELLEFMGKNAGSPWLPQASSSPSGKELLYHPTLRQREGTTSEQKVKAESTGSRQFPHPPPPAPPRL